MQGRRTVPPQYIWLLIIILLLVTSPFRDIGYKLHWFIYAAAIFVFILCSVAIRRRFCIPWKAALFLIMYGSFIGVSAVYSDLEGTGKYLFTLVLGGGVVLGWPALLREKVLMRRVIGIVLVIHLTVLFMQWNIFNVTGVILDVHKAVFPFSKESVSLKYGGLPRFGGLAHEPGSLANNMAVLMAIYLLLGGRRLPLILLGVLGMILTLSMAGIIYGAALGIWSTFLIREVRRRMMFATVLMVAVLMTAPTWYGFLSERYVKPVFAGEGNLDLSTEIKLRNLYDIWQRPMEQMILGYGFEHNLSDESNHVNSSGVLVYMLFHSGFWGAVFVLWIVVSVLSVRLTGARIFALFVFLVMRYSPMYPQFWLLGYALMTAAGPRGVKRWSPHKNPLCQEVRVKR